MFRVEITPPQPLFFFLIFFVWFLSVIIIMIMSSCKRSYVAGILTLNMFNIFMNRKTYNYQKQEETKTKLSGDSPFKAVAAKYADTTSS